MQTTLKLKIAQSNLPRLRAHALLGEMATAAPVERTLHDTYFDTPRLDLWHNGLTLRVRAAGDSWSQTVKTAAKESPALHRRAEWECGLPGPAPDPAALGGQIKRDDVAALLLAPGIVKQLRPVFKLTTQRTTWQIRLPGGQRVECALDAGELHVGSRNAPIGELALALKRGNPAALFDFALALHSEIPLELAHDSKAARGFAMLDGARPRPVKAVPVRLDSKIRLGRALQAMGLNCVRQMESNVPGVLQQGVESLHQMRVGLRRLRALLDMFDDLAPVPTTLRDDLDWLAGGLGAARDWDVLAGSTIPAITGADLAALRAGAQARARSLHGALMRTLHDPRFTQLVLQLHGWFHGRQWRSDRAGNGKSALSVRAHEAMQPLLRKAERRLRRRIRELDAEDEPARHRVRIAAKKARYAAEFFQDLLPHKRVRQYVGTLSGLQDKLGHLNDLAVASRLLAELDEANPSLEGGYARGYVAAAAVAESRRLPAALKAVGRARLMKG
jgi:triphosphatase